MLALYIWCVAWGIGASHDERSKERVRRPILIFSLMILLKILLSPSSSLVVELFLMFTLMERKTWHSDLGAIK
jgi:hypothetical protein